MFASKDLFFSKPSGYQISRSVRFRSSASAYFNRTNGTPTSTTTTTISLWVKRGTIGVQGNIFGAGQTSGTNYAQLTFESGNVLNFSESSGTGFSYVTTQVFRDPSAWYHIVCVYDSTQATSTNRLKMYINGVQVTSFGSAVYPALNQAYIFNTSGYIKAIGNIWYNGAPGGFYFDGYLTEVNFIDGQALTPSSFGQTNTITGVWQPIKYTGTYGNSGFYLNFSDNSNNTAATIGKDYSGNGNNFTPNNISVTAGATYDSMLDVPTLYADGGNKRGNYCVLNPLRVFGGTTVSDGNLKIAHTGSITGSTGTQAITSGKWYWEVTVLTNGATNATAIGIASTTGNIGINFTTTYGYLDSGSKINTGSSTAYGASFTVNDVIGVALDMDAGTLVFYKNNSSQGTAYSGISGEFAAWLQMGAASTSSAINFGQRPFTYTPPTGFVALNTQNLPTPTISNGANYMAATTYTGTGSALTIANTVNGISFQPDFVWVKGRSGATDHALYDSVRGTTKDLVSNSTAAETTQSTGLTAFGSTGFTVGALAKMNTNAATYVGWQWLAGTTSSSNTAGSITSTVSVGATQGFSVVTFTANASQTVGHGLGVAPKMIIVKSRQYVTDWVTYHASLGNTGYVSISTTSAFSVNAGVWNNTSPTSTVFTIGSGFTTAAWGNSVAYCFSEVAGYSKFGSYTGNGSTDGPFIFTGFRPRFVMVKNTSDGTTSWIVYDSARNQYNVIADLLQPNSSAAEALANSNTIDFLSNGFKLRSNATSTNSSIGTYIYAVFAENPFKNSLAR